jgi:hypothetical protein
MALIGLLFVSVSTGFLTQDIAVGCLAFGIGLIGFRVFDCVVGRRICNAGEDG